MSRCSFPGCISVSGSVNDENINFHRFPKNPVIRSKWMEECGMETNSRSNGRVCSRHFRAEDYVRDMKFEIAPSLYKQKRLLKKDAVPSFEM